MGRASMKGKGGFPKMRGPQNRWFTPWRILLKWMIGEASLFQETSKQWCTCAQVWHNCIRCIAIWESPIASCLHNSWKLYMFPIAGVCVVATDGSYSCWYVPYFSCNWSVDMMMTSKTTDCSTMAITRASWFNRSRNMRSETWVPKHGSQDSAQSGKPSYHLGDLPDGPCLTVTGSQSPWDGPIQKFENLRTIVRYISTVFFSMWICVLNCQSLWLWNVWKYIYICSMEWFYMEISIHYPACVLPKNEKTLRWTNVATGKFPISIDDLPIKKKVMCHNYVGLPELLAPTANSTIIVLDWIPPFSALSPIKSSKFPASIPIFPAFSPFSRGFPTVFTPSQPRPHRPKRRAVRQQLGRQLVQGRHGGEAQRLELHLALLGRGLLCWGGSLLWFSTIGKLMGLIWFIWV